jgi:hypothetical protein
LIPLIIFKHQQFDRVPEPVCCGSKYRQGINEKLASMALPFYIQLRELKKQGAINYTNTSFTMPGPVLSRGSKPGVVKI